MAEKIRVDFLQEDNDLVLDTDKMDFLVVPSDQQHQQDIIQASAGEYKENPLVGVGIKRFLAGPGQDQEVERKIKLQLQADGYTLNAFVVSEGKYFIDATLL